jgi:predicted transcriptional regulator YdeE
MEHEVVEFAPFTVIGLGIACPGYDGSGIGDRWMQFNARSGELPPGGRVWGASLPAEDGFYYIAGHEVPAGTPVPEGMEATVIPGAKYFRVHFHDTPDQMAPTFGRIFHELLPGAGLTPAHGPVCLEEYGPDWHDEAAGKYRCDLYVQLA